MKNIIIQALDTAFDVVTRQARQEKTVVKSVSIMAVEPLKLTMFIRENNIPKDCYFGGTDNGYDGFSDFCLCWDIKVPYTDKEQNEYNKRTFNKWQSFKTVHKFLTNEGYIRVGFNSGLLKEFDDTTVFDMYIEKNFDRLVKYYSLYFKKESEK